MELLHLEKLESLEKVSEYVKCLERKFQDGCGKAGYSLALLYSEDALYADEIKAKIHVSNEVASDYFEKSFELLKKQADAGDGEAMHLIAMYYQSGTPPVCRDQDLFKLWTDKSAESGYAVLDDLLAIYGNPKSKHYSLERAVELRKLINEPDTSTNGMRDANEE